MVLFIFKLSREEVILFKNHYIFCFNLVEQGPVGIVQKHLQCNELFKKNMCGGERPVIFFVEFPRCL